MQAQASFLELALAERLIWYDWSMPAKLSAMCAVTEREVERGSQYDRSQCLSHCLQLHQGCWYRTGLKSAICKAEEARLALTYHVRFRRQLAMVLGGGDRCTAPLRAPKADVATRHASVLLSQA